MIKLRYIFLFLAAVVLTQGAVSIHNAFYCFDTDPIRPQNTMYAPVTSYSAARGHGLINSTVSGYDA